LLPPNADLERLARLGSADPVLRLAALTARAGPEAVAAMAERLQLSNAERERLTFLAAPPALPSDDDGPAARQLIYEVGQARAVDLARLAGRDKLADYAARWTPP